MDALPQDASAMGCSPVLVPGFPGDSGNARHQDAPNPAWTAILLTPKSSERRFPDQPDREGFRPARSRARRPGDGLFRRKTKD
jgi:hypothetical protein